MTTQAVTVAPQGGAIATNGGFTRDQVDLIKRTVAEGASDDELALFLEVAKTSGLNPFQRQIYAVMRKSKRKVGRDWVEESKMVIQTGIDGYRLIAARSGAHAGTTDAEYGPVSAEGFPEWARVTVKKMMPAGLVAEFTATARWSEYVQAKDEYVGGEKTGRQVPSGQWPKMPFLMLGKCAEALALRKAFPGELSGVYTAEEMGQADNHQPTAPPAPATPARPTHDDLKVIFETAEYHGVTPQGVADLMTANGIGLDAKGAPNTKMLTFAQLDSLIGTLIPAEGKRLAAEAPPRDEEEEAIWEAIAPTAAAEQ